MHHSTASSIPNARLIREDFPTPVCIVMVRIHRNADNRIIHDLANNKDTEAGTQK